MIRRAERDALASTYAPREPEPESTIPSIAVRLWRALGHWPSGLGVTVRAARQILSLPRYPELSDAGDGVVSQIRRFFNDQPQRPLAQY
jgi:hypothetical protein